MEDPVVGVIKSPSRKRAKSRVRIMLEDVICESIRCIRFLCVLGLVWSGLVWSGLVWSGLVWSGLVWSGLVWSAENRICEAFDIGFVLPWCCWVFRGLPFLLSRFLRFSAFSQF